MAKTLVRSEIIKRMEVPNVAPDLGIIESQIQKQHLVRLSEHAGKMLEPTITKVELNGLRHGVIVRGLFEEDVEDLRVMPAYFKAESGKTYEKYDPAFQILTVFVGLGKYADFNISGIRKFGASAVRIAERVKNKELTIEIPSIEKTNISQGTFVEEVVLAAILGAYKAEEKLSIAANKDSISVENLNVCLAQAANEELLSALKRGLTRGGCQNISRYLGDMVPNELNPLTYPILLQTIAHRFELQYLFLDAQELREMGLSGTFHVGLGAQFPGSLVLLGSEITEIDPFNVIVGKGITYDTGGNSIKTATGMLGMHLDMAGSASAALSVAAAAGLGVRKTLAILGIAENRVSEKSYLPDSIISIGNRSIRIINTDAEGRLVLADGITLAAELLRDDEKESRGSIATLATLAGAAISALGNGMEAAAFSTDKNLRDKLMLAAAETRELVHFFDMTYPQILTALKDARADLRNQGKTGPGHVTAARFLHEFSYYPKEDIDKREIRVPFLHLDMAPVMDGTGLEDDPQFRGAQFATGWGVQLLSRYLAELAKK